jgi:hypothetical protein
VLLGEPDDRHKLLTLLDRLVEDERVQSTVPTEAQLAMLERIRSVLPPVLPGKMARKARPSVSVH